MYLCSVVLRRKHEYFTANITVTYGVVVSMGLSVFNFHPEDFEQRSTLILTVVFTAIAFKFLVTAELPRVPYNTILDGYLNAGIVMLALLFIESSAISQITGDTGSERQSYLEVDAAFAKGAIGLWVLYNLWFVLSKAWYLRRLLRRMGQPRGQGTEYKATVRRQVLEGLQVDVL